MSGLACPCACNSGGFCGGCGHAGCSGGINLRRTRVRHRCTIRSSINDAQCELDEGHPPYTLERFHKFSPTPPPVGKGF